MRGLIALILLLWPLALASQEWEDHQVFAGAQGDRPLRIISSTDTSFFAPVIQSFLTDNPEVTVEYFVAGTADIDRIFRRDPGAFDLVVSSAMDLQLKLTNDGLAQAVPALSVPDWAQWRQSLFAFTAEPAAIVLNRGAFAGQGIPQTRQALIEALRARPEVFRGRIGTYDIRASGLGYLFATQDARASETYWRLMEVMGNLNARLYCCSGEMIDDLISGRIAVAYNVLGSYARSRQQSEPALAVVLPSDFPTTMMRTALVSAQSKAGKPAVAFLQSLVSRSLAGPEGADFPLPSLAGQGGRAAQALIPLEPSLMVYLDRLKRRRFVAEWESAVIQ